MAEDAGTIEVGMEFSGDAAKNIKKTSDELQELATHTERGTRRAGKGIDKLDKSSRDAEKGMKGLKKAAVAFIAAMAVGKITSIAREMSGLASAADEVANKFAEVLKEERALADAFVNDLASAAGRSRTELMGFLAELQDTFVPLGFARDEARKLSQELTALAIDVGSFNNKADADVLRDFQSALVGNTETVRKYGIVITEAMVKQEALNQGLNPNNLSGAEKAQIRYNFILRSTTDAQGDAVRTAGSFANQQKKLESQTKDAKEELGRMINNALLPLIQIANEELLPAINDIIGAFSSLETESSGVSSVFQDAARAAAPLAKAIAEVANAALWAHKKISGLIEVGAQIAQLGFESLFDDNEAAVEAVSQGLIKSTRELLAQENQYKSINQRIREGQREEARKTKEIAAQNAELEKQKQVQTEIGNLFESDEATAKSELAIVKEMVSQYDTLANTLTGFEGANMPTLLSADTGSMRSQLQALENYWTSAREISKKHAESFRAIQAGEMLGGEEAAEQYKQAALLIEDNIGRIGQLFVDGKAKLDEVNYMQSLIPDAEKLRESFKTDFEIRQEHMQRVIDMEQHGMITRVEMEKELSRMKQQELQLQVSSYAGAASAILGLMSSNNKKAFEAQKAVNIGLATMSTAASVMETFKNNGGYPFGIGPALKVGAIGAAQIARIASQKWSGGGGQGAASVTTGGGDSGSSVGGAQAAPAPIQRTTLNLTVSGGLADRAQVAQEVVDLVGQGLVDGGSIDQINLEER